MRKQEKVGQCGEGEMGISQQEDSEYGLGLEARGRNLHGPPHYFNSVLPFTNTEKRRLAERDALGIFQATLTLRLLLSSCLHCIQIVLSCLEREQVPGGS